MVADRRSWHPGQPRSGSVSCAFRCRCGVCARDPRRRRGAAGACVQPRPWRPRGHGGGHARAPYGARAGGDRGRAGMTIGVILMTYGAPTGDEDIAAYLGRVRGRESLSELAGVSPAIVLTAHSLPRRVFEAEPQYVDELKQTARAVAAKAGLEQWSFAYQSAGHTAEEWLRPDLVDLFPSLAAQGATDVLVVPVQFLADHLEVLYDLDIAAAAQAREAGLRYHRIAMPNTRPDFIRALAAIVRAL